MHARHAAGLEVGCPSDDGIGHHHMDVCGNNLICSFYYQSTNYTAEQDMQVTSDCQEMVQPTSNFSRLAILEDAKQLLAHAN